MEKKGIIEELESMKRVNERHIADIKKESHVDESFIKGYISAVIVQNKSLKTSINYYRGKTSIPF